MSPLQSLLLDAVDSIAAVMHEILHEIHSETRIRLRAYNRIQFTSPAGFVQPRSHDISGAPTSLIAFAFT
jgi:hypothetical protein